MRFKKIKKKSGDYRTVCAPDEDLKAELRALVDDIATKAGNVCPPRVVHGFAPERSPITNALMHVGYKYTLCFDLRDFFDDVTLAKLRGKLPAEVLTKVLIDPKDGRGARALQGLPTSPAVANVAAAALDKAILSAIREQQAKEAKFQREHRFVPEENWCMAYTRYADDITFSFHDKCVRGWLLCVIPQIVARHGFQVNAKKTRFMPASAGNRVITGVAVGADGIRATRSVRRRLRAAQHQAQVGRFAIDRRYARRSARGLKEWAALKLPAGFDLSQTFPQQISERAYEIYASFARLCGKTRDGLRLVYVEGLTPYAAAKRVGLSRQDLYKARPVFERARKKVHELKTA